ncbi:lipocalin family protein [Parabacteroides timonensis]|uniref:lipocalin family protein n=1 Tax=Parabacteroides timonensis TaxID=1871013 RepID=UPI001379F4A6|nr:lipocalin family protein [Parabacteroides timonensis]
MDLPWENKERMLENSLIGTWSYFLDKEHCSEKKELILHRDGTVTNIDSLWMFMKKWEIKDSMLFITGSNTPTEYSENKSFIFKIIRLNSDSLLIYETEKGMYLYLEKDKF